MEAKRLEVQALTSRPLEAGAIRDGEGAHSRPMVR